MRKLNVKSFALPQDASRNINFAGSLYHTEQASRFDSFSSDANNLFKECVMRAALNVNLEAQKNSEQGKASERRPRSRRIKERLAQAGQHNFVGTKVASINLGSRPPRGDRLSLLRTEKQHKSFVQLPKPTDMLSVSKMSARFECERAEEE